MARRLHSHHHRIVIEGFVGVNDLGPVETNAHLLKYDSIHGRLDTEVKVDGDIMDVGQGPVKVTAERDPGKLPWKDLGVDVTPRLTLVQVTEPPPRQAGVKVGSVAELVDKLRNEAKVI